MPTNNSVFAPPPRGPFQAPRVKELRLPRFPGALSIWGATGRDFRGHIWVGVSSASAGSSARLFEYDPGTDAWVDHGGVVDKLKDIGLARDGQGQNKIHSKIVPASDGWLYLASTDEEGESPRGDVLPRWGGHLRRVHPVRRVWQHLLATPEGLVAVSGVGRYVYALGYWGHVLYQYDTETGRNRRVVVGSVDGHFSRNFLADLRGHDSLVRKLLVMGGATPETQLDGKPLYDLLLAPTRIYVKSVLALMAEVPVHGVAHITGGGPTGNIPRTLPDGLEAVVQEKLWPRPAVFDWLQKVGRIERDEMHRTFNCGLGMTVTVPAAEADRALAILRRCGEQASIVGEVRAGSRGAVIE